MVQSSNKVLFALFVSALWMSPLTTPVSAQTPDAVAAANQQALMNILPIWMQGKDSTTGSPEQANFLRQFSAKFAPNAVIGVIPQGSNIHVPFARQFYGRSGAQTFARLHWDSVSTNYNVLTPDEQAAHDRDPNNPAVRHPGQPLKFERLADNVFHAVNTADVTVKSTRRSVRLVIDETWTFDSAHHQVQSALFTYSTTELNAAFQPAQP